LKLCFEKYENSQIDILHENTLKICWKNTKIVKLVFSDEKFCSRILNISATVIATVTTVILSSQAKRKIFRNYALKSTKIVKLIFLHVKFCLKNSESFSYSNSCSNYSNYVKPSQNVKTLKLYFESTKIGKLIFSDEKMCLKNSENFSYSNSYSNPVKPSQIKKLWNYARKPFKLWNEYF